MKTLLLKSNHGNHSGFNRKWEVLESFDNEYDATTSCAELYNQLNEIDDVHEDYEKELTSFWYDGYSYIVITQDDYNGGIFNGGGMGYTPKEVVGFFESEE